MVSSVRINVLGAQAKEELNAVRVVSGMSAQGRYRVIDAEEEKNAESTEESQADLLLGYRPQGGRSRGR